MVKPKDLTETTSAPRIRADCLEGGINSKRPCPYIGCKWHLDHPNESCVLDVADGGGVTLEEVGEYLGLTRERIRQIQVGALRKIKHLKVLPMSH